MAILSTNEFRSGLTFAMEGGIYTILSFQHVKPGKGGAFVRTKLRNLRNDNVIERTFKSGEKFEEAYIATQKLQFLYRAGEEYRFMDLETYEQLALPRTALGTQGGFLKENMELTLSRYGQEVVGVELPTSVELLIESTEPGVKGDSSKLGTKPARLETGVTVQVPLFLTAGERIKVDTRTGTYISRA